MKDMQKYFCNHEIHYNLEVMEHIRGDSNPFGQSPLEGVVMKTQGKVLNIGT